MTSTIDEAHQDTTKRFPIARLDLVEEFRRMRASPMPSGHLAKTVLHDERLRIVLMVLRQGSRIPQHHAKGSLAIQALDGRVIVTLLESSFDLGPGQLLAIEPGVSHALVAIEDTALVLTIAP
jgi:quercetin dioxygenase-like cupin family protein